MLPGTATTTLHRPPGHQRHHPSQASINTQTIRRRYSGSSGGGPTGAPELCNAQTCNTHTWKQTKHTPHATRINEVQRGEDCTRRNVASQRRDSPNRRHVCAGTGRRVASLASFGALTLCWRFVPDHVTKSFRHNMHNQRRRVRSIIHTVVVVYRCHDGTATVLRFDWDGRPTVLIRLSVRAVRALRHLVVTCCSSPRLNVRPWDEYTNGTQAANIAYRAFVLPQST